MRSIERISKFVTRNLTRKASARYIQALSSQTLSIIEQLVRQASLTSFDDKVTDLVIGIEHKVSHTQVFAQGIRDQRPGSDSSLQWGIPSKVSNECSTKSCHNTQQPILPSQAQPPNSQHPISLPHQKLYVLKWGLKTEKSQSPYAVSSSWIWGKSKWRTSIQPQPPICLSPATGK